MRCQRIQNLQNSRENDKNTNKTHEILFNIQFNHAITESQHFYTLSTVHKVSIHNDVSNLNGTFIERSLHEGSVRRLKFPRDVEILD